MLCQDVEKEEQEDGDDGQELYCPYCGQSGEPNSFWTEEQTRYMEEITTQKIVKPMLDDFADDMERIGRRSSFLEIKADRMQAKPPVIAPEPEDMIKLTPTCCNEPLKIEEDWEGPIFCLICGKPHDR